MRRSLILLGLLLTLFAAAGSLLDAYATSQELLPLRDATSQEVFALLKNATVAVTVVVVLASVMLVMRRMGWKHGNKRAAPQPQRLQSSQRRAMTAFETLSLMVPARIAAEDIGDAMEVIGRLVHAGSPPWKIYLKTASACFWVVLNATREVSAAFLGKSKAPNK